MSAIFISHSSNDDAIAVQVADQLKERGYRSVFMDFDPEHGIPTGRNWEQELYRHLRACRAVIVLCSEHSMSSDWCFAEVTHARALGKHIFPIRIAPCTLRPQLKELQVIDLKDEPEDAYKRLWRGLQTAGLDPASAFDWDGSRPPYPGLMAFQESDAAIFFGRDVSIQSGLDKLNRLQRFGGARLALLVGASGSGKSSLMRAGLLPRLRRDPAWLVIDPFRPLRQPFDELAAVLSDAFARHDSPPERKSIRKQLSQVGEGEEPDGRALTDLVRDLGMAAKQREATAIVIIDQFEELLSPAVQVQADRFLSLLCAALKNTADDRLMVLGTLRSDFLADFQKHPRLRETPYETISVKPLGKEDFAKVIEGPAEVAGIELESGLVQAMVDDTATEDALPLLAFTLRELWERYGEDGRLTVEEYRDKLGRLHGSVERAAESVVKPLSQQQKDDLRNAFVSMVRINEEGQYIRQVARWNDLPQHVHPLLEQFVKKRLLVSWTSEDQERVLEVAHEALFNHWKQLKNWLDEDRDKLRLRESIRRAANDWEIGEHDPQLLVHRGSRLEAAESLAHQPRFTLNELQKTYLRACVDAERKRKQAKRRRRRSIFGGLLVGLVTVSVLWVWALHEGQNAQHRLATLHWVNGVSERDRNDDPLKASHHFMKAAALTKEAALTDADAQSKNAYFAGSLLDSRARLASILEHGEGLTGAVFGQDEDQVVTWGNGTARVWDSQDSKPDEVEHEGGVNKTLLSPRRTRVMLWTEDDVIQVRDSRSRKLLLSFGQQRSGIPVFSPDERWVLSWDQEDMARLWDSHNGHQVDSLSHGSAIGGATFNSNGRRILIWSGSWSEKNILRVWKHG